MKRYLKFVLAGMSGILFLTSCGSVKQQVSDTTEVAEEVVKEVGVYSPNPYYEYLVGSAVWQLSAESHALMQQAYATAKGRIAEMALKCMDENDVDWTYTQDENGKNIMNYQGKKVAIISDIDDTLVDGVHYTANIIGRNGDFNNAAFARFVMSDGCTALPGSVDFVNYCIENGVEVYYITNRYDQGYKIDQSDSISGYPKDGGGLYLDKDGNEIGTTTYQVFGKSFYDITLESMERLGFPVDDQHLILNDAKLNGSSKEKARNAIINGTENYPNGQRADGNSTNSALNIECDAHYVAMFLGDQLNDFTEIFSDSDLDAVTRAELTEKYADEWGNDWIMLPNAVYGNAMDYATEYGISELLEEYDYVK